MKSRSMLLNVAVSGMILAAGALYAGQGTQPTQNLNVKGECHGVNSCKGTGACGGKGNSCAGKNSCKGKGWLELTKKECNDKKGEFKESM